MSKEFKIITTAVVLVVLVSATVLSLVREQSSRKVAALLETQKGPGVEQLEQSGGPEAPAMPDLDRPIVITAALSEESATNARTYIIASQEALEGDPDIYEEWMNLALYRKIIGDYEGAREIWEYVTHIRPLSGTAYHNLGNLYVYEFQKSDNAEPYYLKAVEVEPHNIQFYLAAYEYYRFVKKNAASAKDVLKRGIAANPDQDSAFAAILASF